MDLIEKIEILTESAKYDVACTSSGGNREAKAGFLGKTVSGGICHSFSADGRCISLLKILMTNICTHDCLYCRNRSSNDIKRAILTPQELSDVVINFYKRNYIEGLFLSSGVIKNPDYTTELMCQVLSTLRNEYKFNGYIHAKAIPGTSPDLISKLGYLTDRMSVNIEMPSEESLKLLTPMKSREMITNPMRQIRDSIIQNKNELTVYKGAEHFVPAGQGTQMVIGATPDSDLQIMRMADALYKKYRMRRVFYSAYIPVGDKKNLPAVSAPLLREHRLYQADWLLRFYKFKVDEILDEKNSSLDVFLDPKCNWALNHLDQFPVEINKAPYYRLLRVPGIGQITAQRIIAARRLTRLNFTDLKKMNVVLKRARWFITCDGKTMDRLDRTRGFIYNNLIADYNINPDFIPSGGDQMSFFALPRIALPEPTQNDRVKCLTGEM